MVRSDRREALQNHPLYKRYWAPTPEERRVRLMPFFWGTLMRDHGSIAGNPARASRVRLTNDHAFSYPGYSEMLTGRAHDESATRGGIPGLDVEADHLAPVVVDRGGGAVRGGDVDVVDTRLER